MIGRKSSVPVGKAARLFSLGQMATNAIGGAVKAGLKEAISGRPPDLNKILFSENAGLQVASQLARMRGAAMKIGQMLSLDSGDLLPPDFTAALASLQNGANYMPVNQLEGVLRGEWGADWRQKFQSFDMRPMAAASIGQVHRAVAKDGRDLAIKIQFPGVAKSIETDVEGVRSILKVSGFLTSINNLDALIDQAKAELHNETDYQREAGFMASYADVLSKQTAFRVPRPYMDLSTASILAMDYIDGEPIQALVDEPSAVRNEAITSLFDLVLTELFELGYMQTDPNFANYKWISETKQIVLLDFGATRPMSAETQSAYRELMLSGLDQDKKALAKSLVATGFISEVGLRRHPGEVQTMLDAMIGHLCRGGPVDFSDRSFVPIIRTQAQTIMADRQSWHLSPRRYGVRTTQNKRNRLAGSQDQGEDLSSGDGRSQTVARQRKASGLRALKV